MLDKVCLGLSYMQLAMRSILLNQQYILNKVPLNRNTYNTRLCVDRVIKMSLDARTPYFPRNSVLVFANVIFTVTL